MEKVENAGYQHFLLFPPSPHNVFYPVKYTGHPMKYINSVVKANLLSLNIGLKTRLLGQGSWEFNSI